MIGLILLGVRFRLRFNRLGQRDTYCVALLPLLSMHVNVSSRTTDIYINLDSD